MKKLFTLLIVGILFPSISWASFYHFSRYAIQTSPDDKNYLSQSSKEPASGVVISGAVDSDLSTNYFGALDFVIENKSDQWMVLKDVKVSFLTPEQNKNIGIIAGSYFNAWSQGTTNLQEYNRKKAAIFGAILGSALMVKGGTQTERGTGAIVSSLSIAELASAKNYKEVVASLPPDHLLSSDILIPPGLFIKRWLVLNSTKHKETGFVTTIVIDFTDGNGKPNRYFLPIRTGAAISNGLGNNSNSLAPDNMKLEKPASGGWQTDFVIGNDGKLIFDTSAQ
jgi:hypothetical protein